MSIEQRFDVPLIARMALREKQIQQSYRPVIGVHKWFARRPGTLFRGLILAEFGKGRLEETFYRANDLPGIRVADPFMGGGTPLIEANRLGCDVEGLDINPMSAWIVREEIERLDVGAYRRAAAKLMDALRAELDPYYRTSCPRYGDADVPVKSFLWVKVLDCGNCGRSFDLFPGYFVANNRRHPAHVLVCAGCGDLGEVEDRKSPGTCTGCGTLLQEHGSAGRGRCDCPHCGHSNRYPGGAQPPEHRLFAIEYHNPHRKSGHRGRFFKKPDEHDLERMARATARWTGLEPRFVPEQEIPPGDETDRLRRWGYARYRDLFNPRQLLGLELSCRMIHEVEDERIRRALATNLSDLLRYQNMLCRYDTTALKALDIFSVHGFPVGLVQCESNFLGISGRAESNVGSGVGQTSSRSTSARRTTARRPSRSSATGRAIIASRSTNGLARSATGVAGKSRSVARARRSASSPRKASTPSSRILRTSETSSTPNLWTFATSGSADSRGTAPAALIGDPQGQRPKWRGT